MAEQDTDGERQHLHQELNDAQASGIGPGGPRDGIYLNIAKARTEGLEFDLLYQPNRRAQYTAALGLLNTKIVNFGSAANNSKNGKELGLAPRVSANIGASFEVNPRLILGGNITFVGKRFTDFNNLPEDRLDSSMVANVNARYKITNAITAIAYVSNLFDKLAQTSRFTSSNQAYFNSPRTVGVKLKLDF